jgi:hypothetical protein
LQVMKVLGPERRQKHHYASVFVDKKKNVFGWLLCGGPATFQRTFRAPLNDGPVDCRLCSLMLLKKQGISNREDYRDIEASVRA